MVVFELETHLKGGVREVFVLLLFYYHLIFLSLSLLVCAHGTDFFGVCRLSSHII